QSIATERPRTHATSVPPSHESSLQPPSATRHASAGTVPGAPASIVTHVPGPLIGVQSTDSGSSVTQPFACRLPDVHVMSFVAEQPRKPPFAHATPPAIGKMQWFTSLHVFAVCMQFQKSFEAPFALRFGFAAQS